MIKMSQQQQQQQESDQQQQQHVPIIINEEEYKLNEDTILNALKEQLQRLTLKQAVDITALNNNRLSTQLLKATKSILNQSFINAKLFIC
jgi:hypothetical protein